MCKPVKAYLDVVREYTREIVMFGGIVLACFVYMDFRDLSHQMAIHIAQNNEILRGMDSRLKELEGWHAREERAASRKPKDDN